VYCRVFLLFHNTHYTPFYHLNAATPSARRYFRTYRSLRLVPWRVPSVSTINYFIDSSAIPWRRAYPNVKLSQRDLMQDGRSANWQVGRKTRSLTHYNTATLYDECAERRRYPRFHLQFISPASYSQHSLHYYFCNLAICMIYFPEFTPRAILSVGVAWNLEAGMSHAHSLPSPRDFLGEDTIIRNERTCVRRIALSLVWKLIDESSFFKILLNYQTSITFSR